MDMALNEVNINTNASETGEMAFAYNILFPDLLLFTIGLSLAFGLLIIAFE
jgi:hypothetical protein